MNQLLGRFLLATTLITTVLPSPSRAGFRGAGDSGWMFQSRSRGGRSNARGQFQSAAVPSGSGSIAIGTGPLGNILWSANGRADSVSIVLLDAFGTSATFETVVLRTGKGTEPTNIAVSPDGLNAWVTLRRRGGVLPIVIDLRRLQIRFGQLIRTGAEPCGIVLDSSGKSLYVANSTQGTVSVINASSGRVEQNINLGLDSWPFALAVKSGTARGFRDEKIYVTQFFSKTDGNSFNNGGETDKSRTGRVTVIANRRVVKTITLKPFECFPFPPGSGTKIFGFPNQLLSIALSQRFGFVVSVGASPQRPLNFQANTHAFVSVFDSETDTEVAAVNLNEAVEDEAPDRGLYFNTPWGIAFPPKGNTGVVVSSASNLALRITYDNTTGKPTIKGTPTAASKAGIIRIPVGKNPRSVTLSRDGSVAYIHNNIGRSLTVMGVTNAKVLATIPLAPLPQTETERLLFRGEELFHTSLGDSTVNPGAKIPGRRMSTNGLGSCISCHPFGWTDTVVWNFPDGPRQTLWTIGRAMSDPKDPLGDERMYNWSAARDELEDFEQNIRKVSSRFDANNQVDDGNSGLIVGVSGSPKSPLGPQDIFDILTGAGKPAKPNRGRSKDWDALAAYMRSIRSPISPFSANPAGAELFQAIGCAECHGGVKWTSSRRPYDPAALTDADAARISKSKGQIIDVLRKVDSFVTSEESSVVVSGTPNPARGADGFNPPSLIGFWAFRPFFHNGRFSTIRQALTSPMPGVPNGKPHLLASSDPAKQARAQQVLNNPQALASLETFLRSIDDDSTVIPLDTPSVATSPSTSPPADPDNSQSTWMPSSTGSTEPAAQPRTASVTNSTTSSTFTGTGSRERRYRSAERNDGFQLLKGVDALTGGTNATTGDFVGFQGIVFVRSAPGGNFAADLTDKTTVTVLHVPSQKTWTVRTVGGLRDDPKLSSQFNYQFTQLPPGPYTVTVTREGYTPRSTRLDLDLKGQVLEADVFLDLPR